MIVILRNLPSDTRRDDLECVFGRFGQLLEIAISHDANLSWIRFENARDARNAVQTLLRNPTPIFGHWTMMYFARPVEEEIQRKLVKTTEDLATYEDGTDTDDNGFVSLSASGARGIENEESSYDSESYDSESESSYDSESSYESSYDSEYSESESELDPNVEPGNE